MSKQSVNITVTFEKGGLTFNRTFNGLNKDNLSDKDLAKTKFVDKYKGIVDGTAVTYDYATVEKGIEA